MRVWGTLCKMHLGQLTVLVGAFSTRSSPHTEISVLIFLMCSMTMRFQPEFFQNLDSPGSVPDPQGIKIIK